MAAFIVFVDKNRGIICMPCDKKIWHRVVEDAGLNRGNYYAIISQRSKNVLLALCCLSVWKSEEHAGVDIP
jgi:hypothetical protein